MSDKYLEIKCPYCQNVTNWPTGYFETEQEHACINGCRQLFLCQSDGQRYVTRIPDDGYVFKNPSPTPIDGHVFKNPSSISPVEIKRQKALHAESLLLAAQLELDQVKPAYDAAQTELESCKKFIQDCWEDKYLDLIQSHAAMELEVEEANKKLRAAVVSLYNEMEKETPGKAPKSHLIDGWGVAVTNEAVYETTKAVNWLIEHRHTGILTVDTKKFNKLLEAIDKPQFVVMVPKVIAKINPVKK